MKKFVLIIILIFLNFKTLAISENIVPIIEGDKNAKIKIIAYESLTCRFCGDFHTKVYPELKKEFIDTGLINIEFRNFPLDLAALNASKIAHCENNGDSKILHYLYKRQNQWIKGNNILEINSNLKNSLKDSNFNLDFEKCVNNKNLEASLSKNPILVTALNTIIGYEKAAFIAKKAYKENRPIIDVAAEETDISKTKLSKLLDPSKLAKGGI